MHAAIDKNRPVPLYQQIAADIQQRIKSKELVEGSRLPGEIEMSEQYGVSRITVRKALAFLMENGQVVTQRGIGTFIAEQSFERSYTFRPLMGFTELCQSQGLVPSTQIISIDMVPAPLWVQETFAAEDSTRFLRIKRLRFADEHPVMIEENYFRATLSDILQKDLTDSLFKALKEINAFPSSWLRRLDIYLANKEEAAYLNVKEGTPLLASKDIAYDEAQQVIFCGKEICNPKRYKFTFHF